MGYREIAAVEHWLFLNLFDGGYSSAKRHHSSAVGATFLIVGALLGVQKVKGGYGDCATKRFYCIYVPLRHHPAQNGRERN
jgi:hypothetical protein